MAHGELVAKSAISVAARPRVLVVDDEEAVVVTVSGILELDGYDVAATTSAVRAIELIHSEHFDVVLTDLRMGGAAGTDGSDVLRSVAEEDSATTTAIVLTGYASLDSAIRVLRQ